MKSCALISLLVLSQTAAVASPCEHADYMQLKTGSKAELQEEYCIATRAAQSNDRIHSIVEDTVAKKRAIPVDASDSEKESLQLIDDRTSCQVRAAKFQVALSRRFKAKPLKSCE